MARPIPKKAKAAKPSTEAHEGLVTDATGKMRITIPEEIGSSLRLLPEGVAVATLEKIMIGESKAHQPKATFRYTITEEMEGVPEGEPTTIGEHVLENYSLQPQALWKLNDTYKAVTGDRLPQGDYSPEELLEMLNETLTGTEWNLVLVNQVPADGSSSEPRTTIAKKTLRK
jgi:hypothetical protein